MEGLLIRGWNIILPRCGVTSLSRGATPAASWLHESQPICYHPGWGFHTVRGGIGPGDLGLRPGLVGFVMIWKDS